MQTAVAFGKEQTLPQPPQLFLSVLVFVSHPDTVESQSAYGALQTEPQTPLRQTGAA
jgi:hypothetical protein